MKDNIAFTAPHWAATEAGLALLEQGATATEAMVAAAAVISVVYPHMNSIGGDGFWLIDTPENDCPIAIDACGRSLDNITPYKGLNSIPERGGLSALTQAGTISGWQLALSEDKKAKLPLSQILHAAIHLARTGFTVSESLQAACEKLAKVTQRNEAFKRLYEPNNKSLVAGDTFKNPVLANLFEQLASQGLNSFYQGPLAESFARDLQAAGSSLTIEDIQQTQAQLVQPLQAKLQGVDCYNLPAPTQGVHSLLIIAIIDKLKEQAKTDADWTHLIVEATKQSFNLRDKMWADPESTKPIYRDALTELHLDKLANNIDSDKAQPWPFSAEPGDTVWMGARDKDGQLVSFIQSIYWEFGSGIVMSEGGFVWNNRGLGFTLADDSINKLASRKKPCHTLNPALARFADGRRLAYGTMGGEGQPQTQAAVFSNYTWRNKPLDKAISDPRWLLGRTWGDDATNLKVEKRLAVHIGDELDKRGHDWQTVTDNTEMMGHAGAIVDAPDSLEAATDPRSDGLAKTSKV